MENQQNPSSDKIHLPGIKNWYVQENWYKLMLSMRAISRVTFPADKMKKKIIMNKLSLYTLTQDKIRQIFTIRLLQPTVHVLYDLLRLTLRIQIEKINVSVDIQFYLMPSLKRQIIKCVKTKLQNTPLFMFKSSARSAPEFSLASQNKIDQSQLTSCYVYMHTYQRSIR